MQNPLKSMRMPTRLCNLFFIFNTFLGLLLLDVYSNAFYECNTLYDFRSTTPSTNALRKSINAPIFASRLDERAEKRKKVNFNTQNIFDVDSIDHLFKNYV